MGRTTIQISDELWEKLNSMKRKLGLRKEETFENVLKRLIKMEKEKLK